MQRQGGGWGRVHRRCGGGGGVRRRGGGRCASEVEVGVGASAWWRWMRQRGGGRGRCAAVAEVGAVRWRVKGGGGARATRPCRREGPDALLGMRKGGGGSLADAGREEEGP